MVSFCNKKIHARSTVSELLKNAREKQHVSLKVAAGVLQLSPKYLQALEDGNFKFFPGEFYIKNFIKRYAAYLELNESELLKQYLEAQKFLPNLKSADKIKKKNFLSHFLIGCAALRQGVVVVVIILFIGYLGFELSGIFKEPPLTVNSPEEGFIATAPDIKVAGETLPGTKVDINGVEVISDEKGLFEEKIGLNSGSNQILITAFKKHGKSASIIRNIIFKDKKSGEISLGESGILGN